MRYRELCSERVSELGFGTMRLPQRPEGGIDEERTAEMVRQAIEGGVNYFDTAYPYHEGRSETVIGRCLSAYPRDSWFLATKYPGHQTADAYDPDAVFTEQLSKCGVDYFDFYLLHNVCESSYDVYTDKKWGIVEYFVRKRKEGKIRHLGFSTHARPDTLEKFLDRYGDDLDFCQIQLNYLDWTMQDAAKKYLLLTERNLPIVVMEPLRGGKLAGVTEESVRAVRPGESAAALSFRFLQSLSNVRVVLSGMSTEEQMAENLRIFSEEAPLDMLETRALLTAADQVKGGVPCTGCRYCVAGCPMGLDIPLLLKSYNDLSFAFSFTVGMAMDALPAEKLPAACVGCGKCAKTCPQGIDVPGTMRLFAEKLEGLPKWAEICRQRAEAAKKTKPAGD